MEIAVEAGYDGCCSCCFWGCNDDAVSGVAVAVFVATADNGDDSLSLLQ